MRPAIPWLSTKALALSAVAVVAAGGLAACSSGGSSSTSGGTPSSSPSPSSSASGSGAPITIGASLSLTGDFSDDGQAFQKGYELWAADVNAKGGILGRKVTLVIKDDHSDVNQAVSNYQTLLGSDKVDMAFGPFSSKLTGPASAVAAHYGMAFIEGAGGAPSVFNTPSNQATHNVF